MHSGAGISALADERPVQAAGAGPSKAIDIESLLADGHLNKFYGPGGAPGKAAPRPKARSQAVDAVKVDGVAYAHLAGGPVALKHGTVVEGSVSFEGLQPNYVVNLQNPLLGKLFNQARSLRYRPMDFWKKVDKGMDIVRVALKNKGYRDLPYLSLLERTRQAGQNVDVGRYVKDRCGVCREHAMLTHLVLAEMGITTEYAYFRASQGSHTEDHAIVLFHHGGEVWILDAYNSNFNGLRLKDTQKKGGTKSNDPRLPFANPSDFGCTLAPIDYPTYWVPLE